MSRNISFSLTTEQIRTKQKTVTRRTGWKFLKPGDMLNACVKCMGLKPGEKIEKICEIRVVSVSQESLDLCTDSDAAREGFPGMTGREFVEMFVRHMRVKPDQIVTRIEFEYVEG